MIHIFKDRATREQLIEMLEIYDQMVKIVVDLRQKRLAGGGEMHSDCKYEILGGVD